MYKSKINEHLNRLQKFNEMKHLNAEYRIKFATALDKYSNAKSDKERLHYNIQLESLFDQANAAAASANTIAGEITADYDKMVARKKTESKISCYASCAIIGLVICCALGMILKKAK